MGQDKIPVLLIKMSLPVMASMLVMALYNIVDSIFVSRLSEDALTAVSLAFPFQSLIPAVGVGTGVGVNSLIARRLGEGRKEEADSVAATGYILGIISGVVMSVLTLIFARPLLAYFTEDPSILNDSVAYLKICGGLCMFPITLIITEKIIQATGDTVRPMLIQMSGALANIILDPIFIFGYFGIKPTGVAGAAIATVAGQCIGLACGIFFMSREYMLIKPRFKDFRLSSRTVGEIYKVGLPSILMQSMGSVTNFCFNKILILFTPTAVSVFGVYFKLSSFVLMPIFGLNSGAMPIMGYNFGAKDRERVMETLKFGVIYALALMFIGTAIFHTVPAFILSFFDASEDMLKIGVHAMRILSLCFLPAAIGIMFSTLFQAVGRGIYSLIVTLCRQLVVLIPAAYILSQTLGLEAVWFSFPIAEVSGSVFAAIMLIRVYNRHIRGLTKEKTVS